MALTIFLPSKQISTTRNKDDKSSLNLKPILGLITIGFAFNCLVNMVNVRAPLHFLSSEIGYSGYGFFETILGVTLIAGLASAALGAKIQQSPRVVFAIIFSAIALSTLTISLLPDPVGWFTLGAIFGLTIGYGQVIMMTQLQLRSLPNQIGRLTGTLVGGNSLGLLAGSFLAGTPLSTQLLLLSACAVAMAASMTLAKSPKAI